MCVTLQNYYIRCGHTSHVHTDCETAIKYQNELSNDYCTKTSNYTSWNSEICDQCNLLLGREILPSLKPDNPLVWMNNVYRASLMMKPEPRDSIVDDSLELALYNEKRAKVGKKKVPSRGRNVPLDSKAKVIEGVGCLLPHDIKDDI